MARAHAISRAHTRAHSQTSRARGWRGGARAPRAPPAPRGAGRPHPAPRAYVRPARRRALLPGCRKCRATGTSARQEKKRSPRVVRERPIAALRDPARARVFKGARRRGAGGNRGIVHVCLAAWVCCAVASSTRPGARAHAGPARVRAPESAPSSDLSARMCGRARFGGGAQGSLLLPRGRGQTPWCCAMLQKVQNPTGAACAAAPRSLQDPRARWVTQGRQRPLP